MTDYARKPYADALDRAYCKVRALVLAADPFSPTLQECPPCLPSLADAVTLARKAEALGHSIRELSETLGYSYTDARRMLRCLGGGMIHACERLMWEAGQLAAFDGVDSTSATDDDGAAEEGASLVCGS